MKEHLLIHYSRILMIYAQIMRPFQLNFPDSIYSILL